MEGIPNGRGSVLFRNKCYICIKDNPLCKEGVRFYLVTADIHNEPTHYYTELHEKGFGMYVKREKIENNKEYFIKIK